MRTKPFALLAAVVLALSFACGESAPPPEPEPEPAAANPNEQFAGAWSLVRSERRDADGELIGEPREDRVGYIMYDPSGYMGVTLMSNDREPYSEGGPTAEEALAQMGSYASYFGGFSVNEEEGYVTHHLEGSLNPDGAGSDYRRYYTIEGDTLRLQPPASEDGSRSYITWQRLPDLPAADLTDTHGRLFGVYRVESVTRQTTDGEPIEGRPVRDRVHHVRAVGAHVGAPDAAGSDGVRRRRADRRGGPGDGPELRQLLRSLLGERGGGVPGPPPRGERGSGTERDRRAALLRADRHAPDAAAPGQHRRSGAGGAEHDTLGPHQRVSLGAGAGFAATTRVRRPETD